MFTDGSLTEGTVLVRCNCALHGGICVIELFVNGCSTETLIPKVRVAFLNHAIHLILLKITEFIPKARFSDVFCYSRKERFSPAIKFSFYSAR